MAQTRVYFVENSVFNSIVEDVYIIAILSYHKLQIKTNIEQELKKNNNEKTELYYKLEKRLNKYKRWINYYKQHDFNYDYEKKLSSFYETVNKIFSYYLTRFQFSNYYSHIKDDAYFYSIENTYRYFFTSYRRLKKQIWLHRNDYKKYKEIFIQRFNHKRDIAKSKRINILKEEYSKNPEYNNKTLEELLDIVTIIANDEFDKSYEKDYSKELDDKGMLLLPSITSYSYITNIIYTAMLNTINEQNATNSYKYNFQSLYNYDTNMKKHPAQVHDNFYDEEDYEYKSSEIQDSNYSQEQEENDEMEDDISEETPIINKSALDVNKYMVYVLSIRERNIYDKEKIYNQVKTNLVVTSIIDICNKMSLGSVKSNMNYFNLMILNLIGAYKNINEVLYYIITTIESKNVRVFVRLMSLLEETTKNTLIERFYVYNE